LNSRQDIHMLVQVSHSFAAIDADQLRILELSIGHSLPSDYAAFLLRHNGGRVEPAIFDLQWKDAGLARQFPHDTVHVLFGIAPGQRGDLLGQLTRYRERIPAGTLPVGMDQGGDLILLGLEAPHTGRVMLWVQDHEVDWEAGETPDFSNVGLAAASFTEFLACLYEP
jgi:hypothetical protein